MKKDFKMSIASMLASELLEYGMLWGNELEWFLKSSVYGFIKFNDDIEYLEFEDMVLEYVKKRYSKTIILLDKQINKTTRYIDIGKVVDILI